MARIRTIKPDFFLHEELAELSPLHRLLFIGLWTLADKEGRLEDRPKRIKASVLPWDDCDPDEMLWDLTDRKLINRYEVDGEHLISIPKFLKHQRPHPREAETGLPGPEKGKSREKVSLRQTLVSQYENLGGKDENLGNQPSPGKEILDNGKEFWEGKEKTASPNPPPSSPKPFELVAVKEPTPRKLSEAEGFFQSVQEDRVTRGRLVREVWPDKDLPKLNTWFRKAIEDSGGLPQLEQAWLNFVDENDFWRPKKFPFAGFMTAWRDHAPPLPPIEKARAGR